MALPPRVSENPAVQKQYLAQLAISAALIQALRALWDAARPTSSAKAMNGFRAGTSSLVEQFSLAAASVAADYYAEVRRLEGVPGAPNLRLVQPPPQSLIDAGLDWAEEARKFTEDVGARILARVEAAMDKAVADVGRQQVVEAVEGDERALGFRRVARPDACYWCLSQAMRRSTRGGEGDQHLGVYKSRESAGQIPPNELGEINRFHNHCHCVVEPVFAIGDDELPAWMRDVDRLYETSTANSKKGERLNDFRRALDAWRNGETPAAPAAPAIGPVVPNEERLRALMGILADFAAA